MSRVSRLDRPVGVRGCEAGSEVQHLPGVEQRMRHDDGRSYGESIVLAPHICRVSWCCRGLNAHRRDRQ